jgi:hypothetical protein
VVLMLPLILVRDDWVGGGVRLKGGPGFTAVIHRRGDALAIWWRVCPHSDHFSEEDAKACAERRLGPAGEPVGTASIPQAALKEDPARGVRARR